MQHLSIAKRLHLLIACAIAALLIVGFVGIKAARDADASLVLLHQDSLVSIKLIGHARTTFESLRLNAFVHVASINSAGKGEIELAIQEIENELRTIFASYEAVITDDHDRALLAADRLLTSQYLEALHTRVLPLSRKHETSMALAILIKEMRPIALRAEEALHQHITFNENNAERYARTATLAVERAISIAIATVIAATLGIGVMGYLMLAGIKKSLTQIQANVGRAERDLDFTQRIPVVRQDEIGATAEALNRLIDTLQGNLKGIQARAETVARSATAMSTTSGQVATAAHQQSEAASHMAATVEELTVSINHVGDRAQEADRLSSESEKLAQSGEAIIGRTVDDINLIASTVNSAAESIRNLERHSQEIANVVAVIKEVADQTNMLALYAAIEAARAGEQGRGFAVVADEVRKLAERTATSTQEIASTIETMRSTACAATSGMESVVSEVKRGVESAREASDAIRKIGTGSRQSLEMVNEITSAIHEQASAMTSIAQQVERIAQMSEESSAAAGNSAQIAKDLDTLAAEVQQIVGAYRL